MPKNTNDEPLQADAESVAHQKILSIANQAADVLKTKLTDCEPKLLAAIAEHEEANQESETPKPFSLGFTIKIDWAGNKAVYALVFSTKYKDETCETLPDPNQPELPGMDEDSGTTGALRRIVNTPGFESMSINGETVLSRKGGKK